MPIQIIVFLYDVLSYPVYRFLGKAFTQVTLGSFSAFSNCSAFSAFSAFSALMFYNDFEPFR